MIKERIYFDGKSQAVDVVGIPKLGVLYFNIYWLEIDNYGSLQEHLRYSTNYMTQEEARDLSNLFRKIADKVGPKEA